MSILACTLMFAMSPSDHALRTNDLAFEVLRRTGMTQSSSNHLFSPTSLDLALGMVLSGTQGETARGISEAMGLALGSDHRSAHRESVRRLSEAEETTVANGVWSVSPAQLTSNFRDSVASDYGAEVERVSSTDGLVELVDGWVRDRTKGRIKNLFDDLPPSTRIVLVNALTFDGKWTLPFEEQRTAERPFATPAGSKDVEMMSHPLRGQTYAEGPDWQALALPYVGDRYRAWFVLPARERDLGEFVAEIDGSTWRGMTEATVPARVSLQIPKFTFSDAIQLLPVLRQMGMTGGGVGDFSPMADGLDRGLIGEVIQKTYVKLDESGTEAAAATGVGIRTTSVDPRPLKTFHADRPFLFAIEAIESGELLFVGLVRDPEA